MMLRYLIEKEFKQLKRNSFLPRLILLFPCMMMLVMPWAATLEIENLRIAVIDNAYLLHHSYASSCPVSVGHGTDDTHHYPVGHYLPDRKYARHSAGPLLPYSRTLVRRNRPPADD
jgi:hypothetical protein